MTRVRDARVEERRQRATTPEEIREAARLDPNFDSVIDAQILRNAVQSNSDLHALIERLGAAGLSREWLGPMMTRQTTSESTITPASSSLLMTSVVSTLMEDATLATAESSSSGTEQEATKKRKLVSSSISINELSDESEAKRAKKRKNRSESLMLTSQLQWRKLKRSFDRSCTILAFMRG